MNGPVLLPTSRMTSAAIGWGRRREDPDTLCVQTKGALHGKD